MKPILFNTDMVHAILEDRKTVTRRVVKPQPAGDGSKPEPLITRSGYWNTWGDDYVYRQPYRPGDILYVRETWAKMECSECSEDSDDCESVVERDGLTIFCDGDMYVYKATDLLPGGYKWHPSIHMPREAARIFLRVTDVRVERLQEITELDILEKEGVTVDFPQPKPSYMSLAYTETRLKPAVRKAFADLWDSTIKPADRALYGWEASPWVWVISFERCEKPEEDT